MFELKKLSFSYHRSSPLLENISFSLQEGEVMAISGPNGAGKTTGSPPIVVDLVDSKGSWDFQIQLPGHKINHSFIALNRVKPMRFSLCSLHERIDSFANCIGELI